MPIMSENSTSASSALTTAFLMMDATPRSRVAVCWLRAGAATSGPSDFFDFGTAKQAGRHEDQHDDQDRESCDILILDRKVSRPERLDQSDREASEHRARQRAYAAENRGRERLDAGDEAHEEIYQAIIQQVHH